MMFKGLDEIDWKSLGHVYGEHGSVPQEIRNLLSEDADIRQQARSFLLGEGQDFGDIYDTTPRIIPFLFEILDAPNVPDKDKLLDHLSGVAYNMLHPHTQSIRLMRLCIQTYDALKAGLDILLRLLNDKSSDVRSFDAELLGWMTDEVESLIPELARRFQKESEEAVQVALLNALKRLLHSLEWTRSELRAQAAPFLNQVLETHPSHKVRLAAAHASVELLDWPIRRDQRLPPTAFSLLSQEFLHLSRRANHADYRSGFFEAEQSAKDLSRSMDTEGLSKLLQSSDLNPDQAHLVVRALLAALYVRASSSDSHWDHERIYSSRPTGLFFVQYQDVGWNLRAPAIYERERTFLQAILDADSVWKIPTNLFSFFYGLPDSREGLKALLTRLDAKTG